MRANGKAQNSEAGLGGSRLLTTREGRKTAHAVTERGATMSQALYALFRGTKSSKCALDTLVRTTSQFLCTRRTTVG